MTKEEIIAAEEYAEKETKEWCIVAGVDYMDNLGMYRTDLADKMYTNFYRSYLFPVKNTGGIAVNTVSGHK